MIATLFFLAVIMATAVAIGVMFGLILGRRKPEAAVWFTPTPARPESAEQVDPAALAVAHRRLQASTPALALVAEPAPFNPEDRVTLAGFPGVLVGSVIRCRPAEPEVLVRWPDGSTGWHHAHELTLAEEGQT